MLSHCHLKTWSLHQVGPGYESATANVASQLEVCGECSRPDAKPSSVADTLLQDATRHLQICQGAPAASSCHEDDHAHHDAEDSHPWAKPLPCRPSRNTYWSRTDIAPMSGSGAVYMCAA
jgi:hypothetical protein